MSRNLRYKMPSIDDLPLIVPEEDGMNSPPINGNNIQVGGIGGTQIGSDEVAPRHLNVDQLSAITADLGTITAGSITLDELGFIKGGQSDYDTGEGFWLGYELGNYLFSLGDSAGNKLLWDGTNLSITGIITATSGQIGGFYIGADYLATDQVKNDAELLLDAGASLIRLGDTTGNNISIDGANLRIRSSNFQTGVSGFNIEPDLIEAENIIARGTLRGSTFSYDVISAIGGQLMVANADTLDSDMTALDSATLTIKGDTVFAVNDILVMRSTTVSGIQEEWLRVTSIASAPTYSVTRDLAGLFASNNNPAWPAGTPVVKQGSSDGASVYSGGWLRLYGEGTNAPYYSVFRRNGLDYNDYEELARFGNLNGIADFATDVFGVFIGNKTTGKYLSFDHSSGDLIVNGSKLNFTPFYGTGSDGDVVISSNTSLTSDMYYNNLTVNNGFTLDTAGYRIFVKEVCNVLGTISRKGNDGGDGGDGGDSGGAGGSAGSAGAALAAGTLSGVLAGLDGKIGGVGVIFIPTNPGVAGIVGSALDHLIIASSFAGATGGVGKAWPGNNTQVAGGAGGAAGAVTASINKPYQYVFGVLMKDSDNNDLKPSGHNGGSGSGGGSGSQGGGAGGSGGGSGGSGSNGGILILCAKILRGNGTITVKGGDGGDGGDGGAGNTSGGYLSSGGGAGGAGNGGNGGSLVLIYNLNEFTGTIITTGGLKGIAGVPGVAGAGGGFSGGSATEANNGADGKLIELEV